MLIRRELLNLSPAVSQVEIWIGRWDHLCHQILHSRTTDDITVFFKEKTKDKKTPSLQSSVKEKMWLGEWRQLLFPFLLSLIAMDVCWYDPNWVYKNLKIFVAAKNVFDYVVHDYDTYIVRINGIFYIFFPFLFFFLVTERLRIWYWFNRLCNVNMVL